jgi:flavin-dependent dehydrogenase
LVRNLERLGLSIPEDVIQSRLSAYILHINDDELCLQSPDPQRVIYSVYRGSGPRLGEPPYPRSFDGWLASEAQARGAILRRERVRAVRYGPRPVIVTARQEIEADLVVLANGINSQTLLDPAYNYRPPRTETMAQDELPLPDGDHQDKIHIYCEPPKGLIFGALIPKGKYVNVSLLGHKLPPDAITVFVDEHHLAGMALPVAPFLCGCAPRLAVTPARGCFTDRLVAVGDAAVTRLYKDGIGSAILTAEAAARTAVRQGVSRADFASGYAPTCRAIVVDNIYGRLLFRLWMLARRFPILVEAWGRSIQSESSLPATDQLHRRLLWGIFTGDESYRKIFWMLFSRAAIWSLWQNIFKRGRS